MNKVQLIGRLTRDAEMRTTANDISVCNFTLAVNRRFKNANGETEADFINCVAWRKSAELICKYFSKGSQIGIVGNIQTRNYEKDGQRHYITEVAVEEVHFVGSKTSTEQNQQPMPDMPMPDGFTGMPGEVDDDLPF